MATGETCFEFLPYNNEPPASNPATEDTRNGHPCLNFDTTTSEAAIFSKIMPRNYVTGTDIVVYVKACMLSATSGTCGWLLNIENMNGLLLTSDNWAADVTITAATVPGTAGTEFTLSATITGSALASIQGGQMFRFRLRRDTANDTATGDAQFLGLEGKQA